MPKIKQGVGSGKTPKIKGKLQQKALSFMKSLTNKVGAEIYTELKTLLIDMNISIDDLLRDSNTEDEFYNLVTGYYNDYMKGVEK